MWIFRWVVWRLISHFIWWLFSSAAFGGWFLRISYALDLPCRTGASKLRWRKFRGTGVYFWWHASSPLGWCIYCWVSNVGLQIESRWVRAVYEVPHTPSKLILKRQPIWFLDKPKTWWCHRNEDHYWSLIENKFDSFNFSVQLMNTYKRLGMKSPAVR